MRRHAPNKLQPDTCRKHSGSSARCAMDETTRTNETQKLPASATVIYVADASARTFPPKFSSAPLSGAAFGASISLPDLSSQVDRASKTMLEFPGPRR
jgi:hypothetical protein